MDSDGAFVAASASKISRQMLSSVPAFFASKPFAFAKA